MNAPGNVFAFVIVAAIVGGSIISLMDKFSKPVKIKERSKNSIFVAVLLMASFLTGCSENSGTSSPQETLPKSSQYLDIASETVATQGRNDFNSLVSYKDDFTKEAYYFLPDEEQAEVKMNDIYLNFFLYKESDSTEFVPTFSLNYAGDDWLFMEDAIFKVNDDVMGFFPEQGPKRDARDGYVSEWLAFNLSKEEINFLGTSKSNSDLDIRVITKIYKEIKLTSVEYKGMKKILSAYRHYLSTLK